ncbi:MAG TPA: Trk system potassium transporter TrkA, partial [Pseudomonadales bacterium]|nr:Trk system potassium transporter TrkA [Pseudomonadales bacterium]
GDVVDQSAALAQRLGDSLYVQTVTGHASDPQVLQQAGADKADMLIAATVSDEVNMVACQVAHSLFSVPKKIARIRTQGYLSENWRAMFARDHMPIDVIISPEVEVARAVVRRVTTPGAFELIPLMDGLARLIGVRITESCPVINTPLRQLTALFPDLQITVIGIGRGDRHFVPDPDDQVFPADRVYFIAAAAHMERAMLAFGREEEEARRVMIIGGGNIGLMIGDTLSGGAVAVRMIELDRAQAEHAAQTLPGAMVINGDALEPEILEEAGVRASDAAIAVTNDDQTNILASLMAKRVGAERTIALINRQSFSTLVSPLDIDVVVNPREITISTILRHVRRGRIREVHSIGDGFGEVMEIDALATSGVVNKRLADLAMPEGAIVGAILRNGEIELPKPSTVIREGDRVVLFAEERVVRRIERLFEVRLEFF